jgi:transposase-like protein
MNNKEQESSLTPETTFYLNLDCPAKGRVGEGKIGVHFRKDRRYLCRECGQAFSAGHGTVFWRLQTETNLIALVVKLRSHGCPVQAIAFAFGLDERTVKRWLESSGGHAQQVHERLVEQPRALGQIQADELRIRLQSQMVWIHLGQN